MSSSVNPSSSSPIEFYYMKMKLISFPMRLVCLSRLENTLFFVMNGLHLGNYVNDVWQKQCLDVALALPAKWCIDISVIPTRIENISLVYEPSQLKV